MASFNAAAMLQHIVGLVTGLSGVQRVYTAVPESLDSRVSAYVTIGDLTPRPHANQTVVRNPKVMVTFAHRVAGAEATAELLLCNLADALTVAVLADRTLGNTSQTAELDMSENDQPAYMAVAGTEFRRYIVVVTGLQTMSTP